MTGSIESRPLQARVQDGRRVPGFGPDVGPGHQRRGGHDPLRSQVQVREQVVEPLSREITVTGQTRASRRVTVRAETVGAVEDVLVPRGNRVERGQLIIRIALDDRMARLAEAKALLVQRQIEYNAVLTLAEKEFRAETQVAEAKALLHAARAAVKVIEVNISKTSISAPFAGVLEERPVDPLAERPCPRHA